MVRPARPGKARTRRAAERGHDVLDVLDKAINAQGPLVRENIAPGLTPPSSGGVAFTGDVLDGEVLDVDKESGWSDPRLGDAVADGHHAVLATVMVVEARLPVADQW